MVGTPATLLQERASPLTLPKTQCVLACPPGEGPIKAFFWSLLFLERKVTGREELRITSPWPAAQPSLRR